MLSLADVSKIIDGSMGYKDLVIRNVLFFP